MASGSADISTGLSTAAGDVAADRRAISVEERRIALAATDLLAAIVGASRAGPLGEMVQNVLTPSANRLAAELRAAGHQVGQEGQA